MTAGNGTNGANGSGGQLDVDVVVVGAGVAGLYMLQRLRGVGLSATVLETGDDVGGTWYWNRYPGARCDIPTTDYTYSWDPELENDWTWSEKYATQPEILKYLQHVADRYDLRRDIRFSTGVEAAVWDDAAATWTITTSNGDSIRCRWYVMATGCLSVPKEVDIEGTDRFQGPVYFTSRWPHEGVDLTGKRVGVIGTGSSGIQSIPIIGQQAAEMVVFQRTPNFSIPARNGAPEAERLARIAADREGYRTEGKWSRGGVPLEYPVDMAASVPRDEQLRRLEAGYQSGELFGILGVFADQATNKAANDVVTDFLRDKIRSIVKDPEVAETLCPKDHALGTKRPCLDTGYYETFNLPHVKLVDLRKTPLVTITETGIETTEETFEFDVLVLATGFDAMTGALVGVDITGKDGATLKDVWAHGPVTYLGLMTVGFPNLFMITGPGSPSVLSNMSVSIEQHVDWIADQLDRLRKDGFERIEPTETAQAGWVTHVNDCGDITLFPTANSWYMGANVPGKPRVFLPYVGGVDVYRKTCDTVVEQDFLGFELAGPAGTQRNDGVVNRLQPDVAMVLEMMAGLDLPPLESMTAQEARDFMTEANAARPTGPEVGEIVDGTLPGAGGDLDYRLYRPASPGPHPVVVYYHGGGWVLGSHETDDPFCRDLCVRSDMVIVSVDYRHAPEARFPASTDDAFAALQWIAAHAVELGGIPEQLIVAGWSAGGNLAAVVSQKARDAGGPAIIGQLMMTPVTDCDLDTGSYRENADGYVLTKPLMEWFFDYYVDAEQRVDPACSPLRADDLSGLPPAFIVTAEFDPLRDEGNAYAAALEAAGVPTTLLQARGHTHTSISMVDVVLSGAPIRAAMADALKQFVGAGVPA